MDLLVGYGSGSESDHEEGSPRQEQAPQGRATLLTSPQAPSSAQEPAPAGAGAASLLSSLPTPAASKAPLFSGLPKPTAQRRKAVVQFRVPISYGPPPDKATEEEEEPAAKKRKKGSTQGMSLAALLPPPKNAAGHAAGGQRLDTTTTTGGAGSGKAGRGAAAYDSDDDEFVPGTEDRTGMVDLRPSDQAADEGQVPAPRVAAAGKAAGAGGGGAGGRAFGLAAAVDAAPAPSGEMHPSEAYRVAAMGGAAAQQPQYMYYQQQQQQQQYHEQQQPQAMDPAEALLQQALEAERARAARRGTDPLAAAQGLQFKEIRADDVRYMDPAARAEVDAIRNALGADYEAQLRAQAGAQPSRLARSRHQIGSLFHQAKLAELKDMELRAQSSKTKAESKRKYGW